IVRFKLLALDRQSQAVLELRADDMLRTDFEESVQIVDEARAKLPLKMDPGADAVLKAYRGTKRYLETREHPEPNRETVEALMRPTRRDPLSIMPGGAMASLSRKLDLNVAALLVDESYRPGGLSEGASPTVEELLDDLSGYGSVRVNVAGG